MRPRVELRGLCLLASMEKNFYTRFISGCSITYCYKSLNALFKAINFNGDIHLRSLISTLGTKKVEMVISNFSLLVHLAHSYPMVVHLHENYRRAVDVAAYRPAELPFLSSSSSLILANIRTPSTE